MPTSADVKQMLTGPGGAFEVVVEPVRGIPTQVYKVRMRSLREVSRAALARGDADTFLVYGDRRMGFGTFVEQADTVSRALARRHGVGPGDRVAVLSANTPEWCLAFWGTVDAAAVLVGLNGWWKTDEILYGLADSGAVALVADGPRLERVLDRAGECPGLRTVFCTDPVGPALAARAAAAGVELLPFDSLLEDVPGGHDPLERAIDEDDPAVIFYTSGTTGRPKGAVSTHRSMIANLQNTIYVALAGAMADPLASPAANTDGQLASLLTAPLFHVSGCHSGMVVALAMGIRLVMLDGRFEPDKALALIERERVNVWSAVPTMVWRVVDHPGRDRYDVSSVSSVVYGGSAAAPELQRKVQEAFPKVRSLGNAYGLTESSSVATVNAGTDYLERPESVGRAVPTVELRITGQDGSALGAGETGEVWVKGPIVMPGYWNKPVETAEILVDGWLRTGDVGHLDEEGFLTITDRAKDMIIRGGENVYCVEIENRLVEHPAVLEAAVIGVPHPTLGEEVKAVVVLEPGSSVGAPELQRWVAETLADFKVPAYVEFSAEPLPRNPSGKLLKNVLRGAGENSFAETF
ncbi:MAG TPA: class I adenylate-forming enzyme family protein [Acidimicrobiales bacterium]|nr:class I adenylate-forming enzyme family protein [Acidimicrobiales bacterium]